MPEIPGSLRPPRLAAAPPSPAAGEMYYDTGLNQLYFYNGTSWVPFGVPAGVIVPCVQDTAPAGYLLCDGSAVSRTTYPQLFAALVQNKGSFTVTIASPGVFTTPAAHGLVVGDTVYFETTGALPTGLTANQAYDVTATPTTTTFRVTATVSVGAAGTANAGVQVLGTDVNTSGTQSGTHTLFRAPFAQLGAGKFAATTFQLPDLRGDTLVGFQSGDNRFGVMGLSAGEKTHQIITGEMAAHDHNSGTAGRTGATQPTLSGTTANESPTHSHTQSGGEALFSINYQTNTTTGGGGIRLADLNSNGTWLTGATGGTTTQMHAVITTQPTIAGGAHGHGVGTLAVQNHDHALATVGSGTAHNINQQYTVTNYAIKF